MVSSPYRRTTLDDVEVLFLHHTSPTYIAPPRLSRRQTTGGPLMTTVPGARTFSTPRGEYDLPEALARAGLRLAPDLVVIWADATRANLPRNLGRLPGRKVLMVGDTQHLPMPLRTMITYALSEPFDLVLSCHNRHHLHFFLEAGLRHVAWLPSAEGDCPTRFEPPPSARSHEIVSAGQIGKHHPFRSRLVEALRARGLPLSHVMASPAELHTRYGEALLTLNASLNGDLNLRIGEALAAGACLVTDAGSPLGGLDRLYEAGRELFTYRTVAEAADRLESLLAAPDVALAAARRGWERQVFDWGFEAQRRRLWRLVERGDEDDRLSLRHEPRCADRTLWDPGRLAHRLEVYEAVQERNRVSEAPLRVGVHATAAPVVAADLLDLHRSQVHVEDGPALRRWLETPAGGALAPWLHVLPAPAFARQAFDLEVVGDATGAPRLRSANAALSAAASA
jgi:hypothetical protein